METHERLLNVRLADALEAMAEKGGEGSFTLDSLTSLWADMCKAEVSITVGDELKKRGHEVAYLGNGLMKVTLTGQKACFNDDEATDYAASNLLEACKCYWELSGKANFDAAQVRAIQKVFGNEVFLCMMEMLSETHVFVQRA